MALWVGRGRFVSDAANLRDWKTQLASFLLRAGSTAGTASLRMELPRKHWMEGTLKSVIISLVVKEEGLKYREVA